MIIIVSISHTHQTLSQELYKRQSTLEVISDKLQPILAVLNFDETPSLDELVQQVESNSKNLAQIEINLLNLNIGTSQDNLATKNSERELTRSRTISEGTRKHNETNTLSISGHIKQRSEIIEPLPSVKGQQEDNYAEIGSLRVEILNRQFSVGSSNIPGPSLRGRVQSSSEVEGQTSSLYEKLELPSPLAEFDHVSIIKLIVSVRTYLYIIIIRM